MEYGAVTSSNLTAVCYHTENHLTRDKNYLQLITDEGAGTPTISKVLWTGHILENNPSSCSYEQNYIVIITPKHVVDSSTYGNLSSDVVQRESRYSILHETSHQLGADDHYCKGDFGANGHCSNIHCYVCNNEPKPICIMTERTDIESTDIDDLYCSTCTEIIGTHLSDHH